MVGKPRKSRRIATALPIPPDEPPHTEAEKEAARDKRRAKQAEMETRTAERYKEVFAKRKTSRSPSPQPPDTSEPSQHSNPKCPPRPKQGPIDFGKLSVFRNIAPIIEKGKGKWKEPTPTPSNDETKPSAAAGEVKENKNLSKEGGGEKV